MPDSFQNPVNRDPNRYRVEEIQRDSMSRDPPRETPPPDKPLRSIFAAYISLTFKKFIDLFGNVSERGLAVSAEEDVREHLVVFKAALDILKVEDRSQDSPFLNRLSVLWHQMLEDVLRFRRQTALAEQMRLFIKEIQHYPEHQEHSLGYYLSEYAGQQWLPFPYMEMILRLHSNHNKNPPSSVLTRWTEELDEMIAILSPAKSSK